MRRWLVVPTAVLLLAALLVAWRSGRVCQWSKPAGAFGGYLQGEVVDSAPGQRDRALRDSLGLQPPEGFVEVPKLVPGSARSAAHASTAESYNRQVHFRGAAVVTAGTPVVVRMPIVSQQLVEGRLALVYGSTSWLGGYCMSIHTSEVELGRRRTRQ